MNVGSAPKSPLACQVSAKDLTQLPALHNLLLALNDPLVSRSKLQMLTASIPTLAARVLFKAKQVRPNIDSLGEALTRLGNKGLETVLLEFLEDLTIFKAEMEPEADPPATEPAPDILQQVAAVPLEPPSERQAPNTSRRELSTARTDPAPAPAANPPRNVHVLKYRKT